jgi:hypothetical protein
MFLFCSLSKEAEMDKEEVPETPENEPRRIDMQPLIDNLRERMVRAQEVILGPPDKFIPEQRLEPDRPVFGPLIMPTGDAAQLLENQLSSGAALVGYLAQYIARDNTHTGVCLDFMERMTSMMNASANVGKVVSRLRNGAVETRHRLVLEKEVKSDGRLES